MEIDEQAKALLSDKLIIQKADILAKGFLKSFSIEKLNYPIMSNKTLISNSINIEFEALEVYRNMSDENDFLEECWIVKIPKRTEKKCT